MTVGVRDGRVYFKDFELEIPNVTFKKGFNLITGLNGSGKTVLLRTLLGVQKLDEGLRTILEGTKLGYVPQTYRDALFPWIPAWKNIHVQNGSFFAAYRALKIMGFTKEDASKRPSKLSGGQCQRLAVVKEAFSLANFIFLDEPFSSIDKNSVPLICEFLAQRIDEGKTIISTTHIELHDSLANRIDAIFKVERISDTRSCVFKQ